MENTTENKARFFALYYGQVVFNWVYTCNQPENLQGLLIDNVREGKYASSFLSLRSILSLTDEEITTLCTIIGYDISKGYLKSKVFSLIDNDLHIGALTSQSADYLRSIGILIPWMDLSVKQIIEYGWAKEDTSCKTHHK